MAANNSFIKITKQESLAQDKYAKNGNVKTIYWVAKNNPFMVHISSSVNLNQSSLLARVVYDTDKGTKEVETLKQSPLEYQAHIDETGFNAAVDIRLKVLSSQQEGAFFRIVFSTVDAQGKLLEVVSGPIKVVSKKLQIRRLLAKQDTAVAETPLPPPKRTSADIVTDALNRLERQQQEQTKLLQQLIAQQAPMKSTPFKFSTADDGEFESSFQKFLGTFQKIPVEERPNKVRKTLQSLPPQESNAFGDLINMVLVDANNSLEPSSSPFSSPLHPLPEGEVMNSSDIESGMGGLYFGDFLEANSPSSD